MVLDLFSSMYIVWSSNFSLDFSSYISSCLQEWNLYNCMTVTNYLTPIMALKTLIVKPKLFRFGSMRLA